MRDKIEEVGIHFPGGEAAGINIAGYSVLTLLAAALAVFWTRSFPEYSLLWKALTVLADILVLGLILRWKALKRDLC